MRLKGFAIAAAVLAATPALAAEGSGAPFKMTAAELARSVSKTTDGLATTQLPTGARGPVVVVAHREQTGEVEVHDNMNDVFVVQSGRASVQVGGAVAGNRQTAPGEWRGGKVTGAQSYDLGPGDVLWIPAGLPHLVVVPKGGAFTYMAFKSAK